MAGRPKKYKTRKALSDAIDRYFNSISRTVTAQEKYDTGKKDSEGHNIYDYRPILNDIGEEIRYVEYVIPPTVGGLCEFLGIHRSTWAEYCDEMLHPEFTDTTTRARGRMRAWNEQQLVTRAGKDVKGIIFNLQNNYGYTEKHEYEFGPKAAKAYTAATMSTAEKRQLLEEMSRELLAKEDGEASDDD